jgi:hypothetical protein
MIDCLIRHITRAYETHRNSKDDEINFPLYARLHSHSERENSDDC